MEEAEYRSGDVRGYKVKYNDGISYTLSLNYDNDNDFGICLDIPEESWQDIINMTTILSKVKADIYKEDKKQKEIDKKYDEYESKWYIKFLRKIEDVTIQVSPFEWRINTFFVSRPVAENNTYLSYKVCKGFRFLFLTITW